MTVGRFRKWISRDIYKYKPQLYFLEKKKVSTSGHVVN